MSESPNRFDVAAQSDPQVLSALLLAAGEDIGACEQSRQAYHGHMDGARFSPFVLHGILLSAVYASIVARSTQAANTRDGQPAYLKLSQLSDLIKRTEALATSVRSLPRREEIDKLLEAAGKTKENPDLVAFLNEWGIPKSQESSAKRAVTRWLGPAAVIAVMAAIVFGAGYVLCWVNLHKDVDVRVDRMITAQPAALRAELLLQSHGGSLTRERVNDGKGEGIVMRPGDLPRPWISADGNAAVVPIQ